ncbi:hypothetical protein V6N13_145169 [Hibiscus sabdariffa]|uniref:Uncharacterized protein n=1 Tax=Hibiscus sabdariffa TaxID=183260 RepID=A0ABR2FMP4_9ROSI
MGGHAIEHFSSDPGCLPPPPKTQAVPSATLSLDGIYTPSYNVYWPKKVPYILLIIFTCLLHFWIIYSARLATNYSSGLSKGKGKGTAGLTGREGWAKD